MPDFYGSVDGFAAYHSARNHDVAVMDETETEAALLVASEWIDARNRTRFSGTKDGGRSQIREWPRLMARDIYGETLTGIPREVEYATYEAAAIQGATPGALSVNFTPGKYESVSIDGALSVKYASVMTVSEVQTQFAIVTEVLAPVLSGTDVGVSYVGSSSR